ncbi:MAG: hypothetical protein INR62_04840 [Rhodospirillales bacterium]|nr:hypothetical protein [Acetobacter sp.]
MSKGEEIAKTDELHGVSVPFEVIPSTPVSTRDVLDKPVGAEDKSYSPERQRDRVRLVVAVGLLGILGYLVIFATIEAASYPAHWTQTKEMLQIILPAVTGIIGTVIGFYFGTAAVNRNNPPDA